jgi:hypothetical protein
MMPRLGQKYELEIETISKPKAEYQTDEYFELDLPVAPGTDVSEEELEAVICRNLGLPPPGQKKKGVLGRLFS